MQKSLHTLFSALGTEQTVETMIDVECQSPAYYELNEAEGSYLNLNVESWGYRMAQFYHYSQIICARAGQKSRWLVLRDWSRFFRTAFS
jgi:hypothetical protein